GRVPRPARPSGVRASVAPNSVWVRLSTRMRIYRMRAAFIGAAIFVALQSQPAFAWGSHAHRYIMGRAIDALPASIKPFFEHFRAELVVRAIDPDTWRTTGWEDDPNHFLDFGAPEYGPRPFVALPREYGAAIEKFGMATLKKYGVLPWREAEEFGNLRRAPGASRLGGPSAPVAPRPLPRDA